MQMNRKKRRKKSKVKKKKDDQKGGAGYISNAKLTVLLFFRNMRHQKKGSVPFS